MALYQRSERIGFLLTSVALAAGLAVGLTETRQFHRAYHRLPVATITGTPAGSARGKTYVLQFTARNGVGQAAVQRFTMRVI